MMLRIALRLQRTGTISLAALGAVITVAQAAAYARIAGDTAAARVAFAERTELLARQLSYLLPLPARLDTMGGYLQWRAFGFMPVIFAFWALLAASGAVRGEEERGLLEQWLGTGLSRGRLVAWRLAAFALAALAVVVVTCAGAAIGAARAGDALPLGDLAGEVVDLWAVVLACYGLALLAAQFAASRRGAAGLGGAVLLALYLLDAFARSLSSLHPYRWLSPFYLYDMSRPLVPGDGLHAAALAALLAETLAFAGLAALAFRRRDVGAALWRRRAHVAPATHTPATSPLLRVPVLPAVYQQRLELLGWAVATGLLAVMFVSLSKTIVSFLETTPALRPYLALAGGGHVEQAMIGFFWFGMLQLLLAIYAVTQAARWAAEDGDGRLEAVLSAPVHRWRVVMERAAALALSCLAIVAVGSAAVAVTAAAQPMALAGGALLNASWLVVLFALTFGAIGAALTGFAPRATVAVLAAFAVVSYLVRDLAPLFGWPKWVEHISVFSLFGTPLATGVWWTGALAMLAVVAGGFGVALVAMQRRDVGG